MIEMYSGTIGSGKSYHALERIVEALQKGKHVIANFPLSFTDGQIKRGLADRFMYMPDDLLMGTAGVGVLGQVSIQKGWVDSENEGECLVVIDEATNYFPKEDAAKPEQRVWRTFFTQSRKFGYDFILILQDDNSINKTIKKCIEYNVMHRKANNIFPFKLLNIFKITLFFYVTYWLQQRQRLSSSSTIFVKRFAKMYQHKKLFGNLGDTIMDMQTNGTAVIPDFGNCRPDYETQPAPGGVPSGEGPDSGLPEQEMAG